MKELEYYLKLLYWEAGLLAPSSLPKEPLEEAIGQVRTLGSPPGLVPDAVRYFRQMGRNLLERAGVPHIYEEVGEALEKDLERALRFP